MLTSSVCIRRCQYMMGMLWQCEQLTLMRLSSM